MQDLPVKLVIDRASLATADGATHHGIFDVAFLSHIPNMTILSPITYGSLSAAINVANSSKTPIAIRYPNASESEAVRETFYKDSDYSNFGIKQSFKTTEIPEYIFVTYGGITPKVLEAEGLLRERGISVGTVLLERLKPCGDITERIKEYLSRAKCVLFVEEGIKNGGAGMLIQSKLSELSAENLENYEILAIDDNFAIPDSETELYTYLGMSPECLFEKILKSPLEKKTD